MPAPPPRVDVRFALSGLHVPLDHGYALFGALCRVLGDLHGAPWLAVAPLRGVARADGLLALTRQRGYLELRVDPAQIPRILPLAGKTLDLDGYVTHVGTSQLLALEPARSLTSRMAVIKGFTEPGPFAEAVRRQLDAQEIKGTIDIGRRRVLRVANHRVVGFATSVHDLSDDESLQLQAVGIGGRQRMGCGVFVPMERAAS